MDSLHFFELSLIPWCETKKPRSFLAWTPKTHILDLVSFVGAKAIKNGC
jgi:hypothetical protein